jgi:two-component system sensor histidine kinase/response regulator
MAMLLAQDELPRVLVVDDHPANVVALQAVLSSLPLKVAAAYSGLEALEAAEKEEFAVILLDVMMPELDGLDTLARLRQLPGARTTPVIVMTAGDQDSTRIKRAYALGAADFIAKPLDPDIVVAKIRVFVTLWQQAQRLAAKDRHMGVLAHDLRTPLATVAMAAARIEEQGDEAVRVQAARIVRVAQRMAKLTEDVLEFARASAANVELQPTRVDLAQLCLEMLEDFQATHPGIRFEANLPTTAVGYWDPARLAQALSNLIGNAVKFGTGWVALRVQAGTDYVAVAVENGGSPIPLDRRARLFHPFERGTKRQPGVGLGLYIVHEIALAHGGQIALVSDVDRTSFELRLPLHASDVAAGNRARNAFEPLFGG